MKNTLLILVSLVALTSCVAKTPTVTQTGVTVPVSTGATQHEEVLTGATATGVVSSFPAFTGAIGSAVTLEKDFCVDDLCIRHDGPIYQDTDGKISQHYYLKKGPHSKDEDYLTYEFAGFMYMKACETENADHAAYLCSDIEKNQSLYGLGHPEDEFVEVFMSANPAKNTISKEISIVFSYENWTNTVLSHGIVVKSYSSWGCGSVHTTQEFFDANGQQITDIAKAFPDIPKTFSNTPVQLVWNNEKTREFMSGIYIFGYSEYDMRSLGEVSMKYNIKDFLIRNAVGQADYYLLSFTEYPGVAFAYQNTLGRKEAYLTGSLANTPTNAQGMVTDLRSTQLLLERLNWVNEYGGAKTVNLRKKGEDITTGLDYNNLPADVLPLFQITKLENGDALLSIGSSTYEWFTTAELCKPVVYVYDKNQSKNSLTVGLPQGGNYTKLIPHFSYGNTWNFVANKNSEIFANNGKFDYLYYSARVPNYQYNQNGWQVYGRDAEKFLSEKLDYIGFNATEKKDFIDFWKTEFHSDTLYFVSFKFDSEIEKYASLEFARKPKSQIRVLLEAHPLNMEPKNQFLYPYASKKLDEKLLKKFQRSGEYDVFEWGGVVEKNNVWELIIR